MKRFAWLLLLLTASSGWAAVPSELAEYVKKDDGAFQWKQTGKSEVLGGATVYDLQLVSQKWQGVEWDHGLQVVVPKGVKPQATMLVWNQGGSPSKTSGLLASQIADRVKAPVAFLYGIPKQPLYGGKKEDALIAETFVKYLETKDASWPLLFPMAKSLIRTMDTLQAFAKKEWQFEVSHFIITGASKRGWTSWLTAASGDPRVKAIAPMVIDTLNFPKQMPHQLKSFGRFSEMIHDYEERKLLPLPDTEDARRLWTMVDPWNYREVLTLPKLIINGTNDPYWTQDALNQYWDDLTGPKWICYVPNAGHDLRPQDKPNQPDAKRELLPTQAINALSVYSRHLIEEKPLPEVKWNWTEANGETTLTIHAKPAPKQVRFWSTSASSMDFRKSKWQETGAKPGQLSQSFRPMAGQYAAVLGEIEYEYEGIPFKLSTQIKILNPSK